MRELVRLAEEREAQAKAALAHLLESRSTALEESDNATGGAPAAHALPVPGQLPDAVQSLCLRAAATSSALYSPGLTELLSNTVA